MAAKAKDPKDDKSLEKRPPLLHTLVDRLVTPQFILTLLSMGIFYWLLNRLLEGEIPDTSREIVSAALGFLIGQMIGPGFQFYVGNTKSAEDKTVALRANAEQMRDAGLPVGGDPRPPIPVQVQQPPGEPVPVAETHPDDAPRPGDSA